jgi:hypothetical protein
MCVLLLPNLLTFLNKILGYACFAKALKNLSHIMLSLTPFVTPPKLGSANPVELLAIHSVEPTCDQMENHPYKNVRVNAKKYE